MLAYAAPVENVDDSQTGSSATTTTFASDQEHDYTQHITLDSATSSARSLSSSSEFDTLANFFSDYSSSTLSSSQKANAVPEIRQTVSDDDTFDRITTSDFSLEPETSTSAETLDDLVRLPIGVTIVIVLASACVVLGLIYAYIYFTQIQMQTRTPPPNNKPSKKHSSAGGAGDGRGAGSSSDHQGDGHDDGASGDGAAHSYTHMFLFRKHHHAPTIT